MPRGNNAKRLIQQQNMQARLPIVAELWRKNWTEPEIRLEVMRRLGLETYSSRTVHKDVLRLIDEWKQARLPDIDAKVTAELARLDLVIREAWEMWEKSKEDHHDKSQTQHGTPVVDDNGTLVSIETVKAIMNDSEKRGEGDPRYLDIVLKALQQRIKLLGLDKSTLDINAHMDGKVEVTYRQSGTACASSEEEVMRREGMI